MRAPTTDAGALRSPIVLAQRVSRERLELELGRVDELREPPVPAAAWAPLTVRTTRGCSTRGGEPQRRARRLAWPRPRGARVRGRLRGRVPWVGRSRRHHPGRRVSAQGSAPELPAQLGDAAERVSSRSTVSVTPESVRGTRSTSTDRAGCRPRSTMAIEGRPTTRGPSPRADRADRPGAPAPGPRRRMAATVPRLPCRGTAMLAA